MTPLFFTIFLILKLNMYNILDFKKKGYVKFLNLRCEGKVIEFFWDVMYNTYLTFKCIPQIPTCFYSMNL
jgi:hypothetical protein